MSLAILIYLLVFVILLFSIKVFYFTTLEKETMQKTNANLQNQLHDELLKQEHINQKLKLVVSLNQSLRHRIFKLFKDIMAFNKLVFENT